ncbi:MAG TPA: hypothetical protein VEP68_04770 [Anaeromyxobacteraceae bacterium]|nr:hypothetical protein [Anaeromyxobacteraceae bacterium]
MPPPLPLLIALAATPAAAPAEGKVVEEVVAVIRPAGGESRVVTLSKLTEEARIVLISRGATEAALRPLDGPALKATLDWYVDQTLLSEEAARLQVAEVESGEARAELGRFRGRFARPEDYAAFLARNDMSDEDVLAVLSRMLRVQRYLDSRVATAARARVSDADVEAAWKERRAEFGNLPLAQVREAVRARLAEERIQAEVKSLLADLRRRAEIRVLVTFGAGP